MLLALLKKEFYLRWHAGWVLMSIMGDDIMYKVDSCELWFVGQFCGSVEFGTVKCCFEFWKSSHSYADAAFLQFPAREIFPSTASSQIGSLVEEFVNYT